MPIAIVLMGVSGSGKTTVGKAAAAKLGWRFLDADAYHPPPNIEKMAAGTPLTDEDRWPWLQAVHHAMLASLTEGESVIMACSALKASYRKVLRGDQDEAVAIIYLKGSYDLIHQRMKEREDHFFEEYMLQSQFNTLEEPDNALTISVAQPIEDVVQAVVTACKRLSQRH